MSTAMSSAKSWHNQALGQAQAKESIDAASRYGIIEAIKRHLAAGTDVNAKASRGWTPLHSVATKEVAELLIANGADVNAKSDADRAPLSGAALGAYKETADLLRKHGGKKGEELRGRQLNQPTPPLGRRRVVVRGQQLKRLEKRQLDHECSFSYRLRK